MYYYKKINIFAFDTPKLILEASIKGMNDKNQVFVFHCVFYNYFKELITLSIF